jgi:hypothetical protein
MRKRRNHDAGFKSRVALEAREGRAHRVGNGVHPTMIHQWRCTPKWGSWLWPTIFCRESSCLEAGDETRDDRTKPPLFVGGCAMPPAIDLAAIILPRAAG